MRTPRSLSASTPAWGQSRALTAGPAIAALRSLVRRMAALVRAFGAGYVVVQVAIWSAYYAAHPWFLAGPLAAVAWGCAAAAYLRHRRPPWPRPCRSRSGSACSWPRGG